MDARASLIRRPPRVSTISWLNSGAIPCTENRTEEAGVGNTFSFPEGGRGKTFSYWDFILGSMDPDAQDKGAYAFNGSENL
jgi:hypothetical protein